jgi:hypothetical protein
VDTFCILLFSTDTFKLTMTHLVTCESITREDCAALLSKALRSKTTPPHPSLDIGTLASLQQAPPCQSSSVVMIRYSLLS